MATTIDTTNKVSLADVDLDRTNAAISESLSTSTTRINLINAEPHQITFWINNSYTSLVLRADPRTFADWGSFSSGPQTVPSQGVLDVCTVTENHGFFTGAAGLIGFTIETEWETVYLRFAATNPYWSVKDNRVMTALSTENLGIDQEQYNKMYYWGGDAHIDLKLFRLKVKANIEEDNDCTASFTITTEAMD